MSYKGREGVKWELGFAFFRGWEMGFCALGLGCMKKSNNRKMGMGFQFEQQRLGLWDLSWDLKKTISWEMGLGPHFTTLSYAQSIRPGQYRFTISLIAPSYSYSCGLRALIEAVN